MIFLEILDHIRLAVVLVIVLILIWKIGEFPSPLIITENLRKISSEISVFFILISIHYIFDIVLLGPFFLSLIGDDFYLSVGTSTIVMLIIPAFHVHFKNKWTISDLRMTFNLDNKFVAIVSIFCFGLIGFFNTISIRFISLDKALVIFYSNAFLEEFLFRGIFQTKLEGVLGQKKAILPQGILFMLIHLPINFFNYTLNGNLVSFFGSFTFQFLVGLILGVIFAKTRNLWICVICHYLINWLGAFVNFLFL